MSHLARPYLGHAGTTRASSMMADSRRPTPISFFILYCAFVLLIIGKSQSCIYPRQIVNESTAGPCVTCQCIFGWRLECVDVGQERRVQRNTSITRQAECRAVAQRIVASKMMVQYVCVHLVCIAVSQPSSPPDRCRSLRFVNRTFCLPLWPTLAHHHRMRAALLVLALLCGATDHAFGRMGSGQVVFQGNKVDLGYLTDNASSTGDSAAGSPLDYQRSRKIAIIGAGPGGSSAAYFLSKAQSKLESLGYGAEGLDITLFEREERIGGRTAVVHPYGDESMPAIELGASIFADVNKNLQRASRQFKLATGAKIGEPGITGIWDGQQFLIEGLDNGWWNSAKMFWRYGYSPVTTQKLVGKLVDAFLHLYDPTYMHRTGHDAQRTESGYPWSSIEDLARAMKLDDVAAQSAGDYFYGSGVSKLFIEEIIEAATLVNYGQEIYSIHGVGGSVSLAASGATGVVGGNYQIFESMIGHSEALKLRMGSHGEVTGLARFRTVQDAIDAGKVDTRDALAAGLMDEQTGEMTSSGQTTKWWLGTKSGYGGLFDAVFIAAPWHSAEITLLNTHAVIPAPPYVRLHVTIVITKSDQPDPAYFGRGEKDKIPTEVLTSHISVRKEKEEEEKKKERKDRGGEKDGGDDGDDDGVRKNRTARWWPWGGDDKKRGPHLEVSYVAMTLQCWYLMGPAFSLLSLTHSHILRPCHLGLSLTRKIMWSRYSRLRR